MSFDLRFMALLASLLLSACGSTPPDVQFQRVASGVHTIAVLTPATPDKPALSSLSPVTPLGLLGPIGAVADARVQEGRAADYLSELGRRAYSPQAVLLQDISAELQSDGFTVAELGVPRPSLQFLATYPPAPQAHADAYLDVVIANYGYGAGAITEPYRPLIGLQYRLVRASDGATLMQGNFGYSHFGHDIEPDPVYDFSTFDDIMADSARSIAGLNAGFSLGAKAIGRALK
jgi:hypothetical protein